MALSEAQEQALEKIKNKSDDDYEKNVVYIAAGTLVLSMTFLEKIIKLETSIQVWVLILAWSLLALTLAVNLISHQLSSLYHERIRDAFDKCSYPREGADEDTQQKYRNNLDSANRKFDSYNKVIRALNWTTTISLISGMISLIVYCATNALLHV